MPAIVKEILSSPVAASLAIAGAAGALILLGLLVRYLLGLRRTVHPFVSDEESGKVSETALAADRLLKEVLARLPREKRPTQVEMDILLASMGQVKSVIQADIADLKRVAFIDGPGPQEELRVAFARIQEQRDRAADALLAIEDEVRKMRRVLLGDDALLAAGSAAPLGGDGPPAVAPEPAPEPAEPKVEG